MVRFVRDLAPAEKLELYKKIKGFCLFNDCTIKYVNMTKLMDEKLKDVFAILQEEDMDVNYIEIYKDYSYGRI